MSTNSQLSLPDRTSTEDDARVKLPGFGLPVDYLPEWNKHESSLRFPHAISDYVPSEGVALRECRMMSFINTISDKPDWDRKVFDDEIVAKWKEEASVQLEDGSDVVLSEKMFDYFNKCTAELRDKASVYQETGLVHVLDADATIVKSDSQITPELRSKLIVAVRPLEDVPDHKKDWHPGTDKQVLDLLHPSLFPLIFGLTRVLPTGSVPMSNCTAYTGKGEPCFDSVEGMLKKAGGWGQSSALKAWGGYQWLPAVIEFSPEGGVTIASYINNLHPQTHQPLYVILEELVAKTISLWNEALSFSFYRKPRVPILGGSDEDYELPNGLKYERPARDDVDGPDEEVGESELEYDEHYQDWKRDHRILIQPEPREFIPFKEVLNKNSDGADVVDLRKKFEKTGLQVIFKLANIHLTPESPSYDGGSWHIEGALNEHICASAIYYYDEENVTESRLAFRMPIDVEEMVMKPAQSEFSSIEEYYGVQNEEPAIQNLGSISTRSGRLIAFPNILQHKVQPFSLADATRPGHRKILAMFLVDPHVRVLSTKNVPPQRKDWWAEEVRKLGRFAELPRELFDRIIEGVEGFPLGWDEALVVREKLMEERGAMIERFNEQMEEDTFSFCEH
ncbi:hypothetical protein EJ08DRAFT_695046 [Tothia fuscella]|uniref:Uncharacterized protein n=1 Tax=Tothia fuscella TaxID=1048955 RepID=A0A9P4NVE4_9PEZI|nr:hypothetical protein EJ08DRAFT_695046 [Tothia fuscella]